MRSVPLWICTLLLGSVVVVAGLRDSPPPAPESGEPLRIVYRMGAIYFEAGHVDTVISCVNQDRSPADLVLEIFDASDSLAGSLARRRVPPGGEVSFTTSAAVGQEGRAVVPDLPTITHGKARISSTTTQLSCSGYWRARSADGTTKDSALQLVKKVATAVKP